MASSIVTSIDLKSLPLVAKGKVREIYGASDSTLLLVTSDRISAYDVILENGVQDKGTVLTLITNHWLNTVLPEHVPGLKHHLLSLDIPSTIDLTPEERQRLRGRSMIVNKYRVFPVEAIGLAPANSLNLLLDCQLTLANPVRGYITGSSWAEYKQKGTVHGLPQPSGLEQCQAFPEGPIYTPSTKAPVGEKDENITPEQARKIVGDKYADKIERLALAIYKAAHAYAFERGIIVADTKFEFGLDEATDEIVLIDEVLTPDSSRFWPAADYAPGRDQKSFDKQYLRDWLTSQGLKGKEGVSEIVNDAMQMTQDVQAQTSAKYLDAFQRLTGETLDQALAKLEK
ncbi:hypothetical protein NUW58_g7601 [Xylaria curta]|uniref:Uncharacterized protein n=1 Tax=Xylaria curta TaxID=42375 RepID=A0ACC1NGJ5_9PEZI|nr:hypothetical protein NUW58_g7601 [Xylaria curta]